MQITPQLISDLIRKGNLAQADILCRIILRQKENDPTLHYFIGLIAYHIGLEKFAEQYLQTATCLAPDWPAPRQVLEQLRPERPAASHSNIDAACLQDSTEKRFLLIKAWGCGFWSDVDHVLGQLLVAELTGRTPVVFWGENSLFSNSSDSNAFELFFEPVSKSSIDDLSDEKYSYFPPKWNKHNLLRDNINKFEGHWSRTCAIYFLNRTEQVLVSDYFSGVYHIRHWIPDYHSLYGLSANQLYQYLIRKYLKPRTEIKALVDQFIAENMQNHPFISVHVRGTDKAVEVSNLDDVNMQYFDRIDNLLACHPNHQLFLLTDDTDTLDIYINRYGDRVNYTDCVRTSGKVGVHFLQKPDGGNKIGIEVMVDTYIATYGEFFIGNATSNVSAMIRQIKEWQEGDIDLIGTLDAQHVYNTSLYNW